MPDQAKKENEAEVDNREMLNALEEYWELLCLIAKSDENAFEAQRARLLNILVRERRLGVAGKPE